MNDRDSLRGVDRVHLIGAGGIGVSALAPALLARGCTVSGSDPASNAVTERLKEMGVTIYHEHAAEHINGVDLVVATSAAPPDNPERKAAEAAGVPVWARARMLGALVNEKRGIVASGAHGKTTLTAMLTHVFLGLGEDPSAYIGGDVRQLGGNSLLGKGEWAIAEGDESDGSFIYLKPEIALVNNIDADHLDHYEGINDIIEQFELFLAGVHKDGWILTSADCKYTRKLNLPNGPKRLTYGFAEDADICGTNYYANARGWGCDVVVRGEMRGPMRLQISGRCHTHNALGVLAAVEAAGLSIEKAMESLKTFEGVQRRMEEKGCVRGVTVVDDYAHHPNEIRATIQGLRDRYRNRLIGVFQPHLYSRTLKLLDDFGRSFTGLDLVVLTDIYAAREQPVAGVSGEALLQPTRNNGSPALYIPQHDEAVNFLCSETHDGDVVVTMGAGDVWKLGDQLLERLREAKAEAVR
ncbi:MAG: UDP-N-acetylmuramate--L-alanine ligase [Candidatus Hinthialibacter antarcticus]|nr:UDP-N-acetylmuramate--L-alanine ligase [Candidatus Hinthialibacter antarcticus]